MGRTTSILTKPPRTFLLFFIPSSLISTVISPPFFANPMLITYLETPKKPHSHLSFFVSRRPPFAPSTFPICFLSLPYSFSPGNYLHHLTCFWFRENSDWEFIFRTSRSRKGHDVNEAEKFSSFLTQEHINVQQKMEGKRKNQAPIRLIVAGLPRTGTKSVRDALKEVGLNCQWVSCQGLIRKFNFSVSLCRKSLRQISLFSYNSMAFDFSSVICESEDREYTVEATSDTVQTPLNSLFPLL